MSEPDLPFRPPRSEIVAIAGDQLVAVILEGDGVAVPIRLMCDGIGLDAESQVNQLRAHPVLASGLRMVNVTIGDRVRSVAALLHTYIPFWLATISPTQVNAQTRPKLIRYQEELVDILARLFLGESHTPATPSSDPAVAALHLRLDTVLRELRVTREALIAEQQRVRADLDTTQQRLTSLDEIVTELHEVIPITPKHAAYIQRAIKQLAHRVVQHRVRQGSGGQSEENIYQLLFGQFKIAFRIPRYDALPLKKYDDALTWLHQQARELLPDDPDALPPHQEQLL
ncbi:MAG: hypothetical protein HC828_22640 [Blastochloris sp.]|nr:hypothetical protein [Blastochloris sp.]